jgi:hypothetical protein
MKDSIKIDAIEQSRTVSRGRNDVVIANYLVRHLVICLGVKSLGKSISLAVVFTLNKLDSVVEFFELDGPPGLLLSVSADCLKIRKVSVVSSDFDLVSGALEAVSPMFKGSHNGEEFLFIGSVVVLGWGELLT